MIQIGKIAKNQLFSFEILNNVVISLSKYFLKNIQTLYLMLQFLSFDEIQEDLVIDRQKNHLQYLSTLLYTSYFFEKYIFSFNKVQVCQKFLCLL